MRFDINFEGLYNDSMPTTRKRNKAKPRYVKPALTIEKISVSLFQKNELRNELEEFNLLSATSASSDDY